MVAVASLRVNAHGTSMSIGSAWVAPRHGRSWPPVRADPAHPRPPDNTTGFRRTTARAARHLPIRAGFDRRGNRGAVAALLHRTTGPRTRWKAAACRGRTKPRDRGIRSVSPSAGLAALTEPQPVRHQRLHPAALVRRHRSRYRVAAAARVALWARINAEAVSAGTARSTWRNSGGFPGG